MTCKYVYFFTDIESDGPVPGLHSMISFASVAVGDDGTEFGEFEANLVTLPSAKPHPETSEFWQSEPEAWAYCTKNPRQPKKVMPEFAEWVESFPGLPVLAAHPICFDHMWIMWYLRSFTGRSVFKGPGLDLMSFAMGTFGRDLFDCHRKFWPEKWLGGFEHSHRALDDARGYAHAFFEIKKWSDSLNREHLPVLQDRGGPGAWGF